MANIYDGSGQIIETVNPFDTPIITGELPVIFIESNTAYTSLTKETASDGTVEFVDGKKKFKLAAKIKLQGSGALNYAKKNLNITFYNDSNKKQKVIFNDWYPTNKIHLKANEYDYSMCRNSVGAILTWEYMGRMLPKGAWGYIRSFPVIMYYNGVYMGCHTWNMPQDGKTYNFTDSAEEACTNLAYRCGTVTSNTWMNIADWEYRGDVDETTAMNSTFSALLAIMSNTSGLTKEVIEAHFDTQTLLGYMVFCQISCAVDSMTNNWTLVTWDGVKWYHTFYDLDICFGIGGNDGRNIASTKDVFTSIQGGFNTFFAKVKELYATEFNEMWATFRNNGADVETITKTFADFQGKWGWQNLKAERDKWGSDKLTTRDIDMIGSWLTERFAYFDSLYGYGG